MLLTLLQFFASKFLVLALHLEAGSFPRPLSPQEEIRTFAALRAGDPSAREKLIRHNLRLVAHIAKKYYALPSEQDDLISIGTIGLMKAVDTFDSTAGRASPLMPAGALKMLSSPSALWDGKENPLILQSSVNASKWIFWSRESGSFFLLQRVSCEGCGLTPLYILQVSLAGPRTTVEAQAFYRMYHSYADIPNPWDRLRWCRYGLDLLQKEVAAWWAWRNGSIRIWKAAHFTAASRPNLRTSSPPFTASRWRIFWTTTPCFCTGAAETSSTDTGRQKAGAVSSLPTCKGQPDKHLLLGKWTKDHQSEVLLPSGGKPWFRFSIYASHVRYGNFSPVKRKSSSASHDMWQRRRAFVMESFCFNYSNIRSDLHGVP